MVTHHWSHGGGGAIQSGPWNLSLCTTVVPRPVSHWMGLSHLQCLKDSTRPSCAQGEGRQEPLPAPLLHLRTKGPKCPHHAHPSDSIYCLACSRAAPGHQLLGTKNKAHTSPWPQAIRFKKTMDTLASCLDGKGLKPARSDQEAGPGEVVQN